jgi:hypothetical protein
VPTWEEGEVGCEGDKRRRSRDGPGERKGIERESETER